jgi:hypothetical protein
MARFKDFGAPFNIETAEKLTFKLYGEDFHCFPEIQGKVLLEFSSLSDSENPSESSAAIVNFFKSVMDEESYGRFDDLATDPTRIVSVQTLAEIVEWLVGEYTNRPNLGLEHSSTGE